jgi:hypothetical protein
MGIFGHSDGVFQLVPRYPGGLTLVFKPGVTRFSNIVELDEFANRITKALIDICPKCTFPHMKKAHAIASLKEQYIPTCQRPM